MAKRKHVAQRSRINEGAERPGFTRRSNMPPPSARRSNSWLLWVLGIVGVIAIVGVLAYAGGFIGRPAAPAAPAATPLANPPAEPASDGTTATITTDLGTIVIELYTDS